MSVSTWFQKFTSVDGFYEVTDRWVFWLGLLTALFLGIGVYWSLWVSPPDYQQGESVRIMYIHVPSAWMSMFVYMTMAGAAAIGLVWESRLAEILAVSAAPLGAWFTFLALATGSLWGKPMWGAWWVWDARLTSELILLFLYFGFIALQSAIPDRRSAARASGVLALVGLVNIPIIHFSVEWWNTLHQPSSLTRLAKPSIHPDLLWPLLIMAIGFKLYYATAWFSRARCEIQKAN